MKSCVSFRVVLGIVLLSVVPAYAVTVDGIQFYLLGGPAFSTSPSPGKLSIDESPMDASLVSGSILLAGGTWADYEIRDAAIMLTPTNLLSDQSYTVSNPYNSKIAKGNFAGGATLTITGSITTTDGAATVFPTGTLLQATVKTNYLASEQEGLPDGTIDMQQALNVTGGELKTGAVTGFVLNSAAIADITLYWCYQPAYSGMSLKDFKSGIEYLQPSIIQIYADPTPEPISIGLFGFGAVLALRRRK